MQDFKLVDYSDGTVVELPNHVLSDVAYYQAGGGVGGAQTWNLAPIPAMPYEMETDGRAVVDPSWQANPGISTVVPVADLDNQGRT
ncbi:MAG: hypothetical protein IAI50_15485 [Candidatus Eremiobacteraeota bacterium]|nr:hypothetical protein [Candidatus Eremiobacteraeota bacterium]